MIRKAILSGIVMLALCISSLAEDYPFKKNPDQINVWDRYVQHSWIDGRVWLTGADAKQFLGYGSGRESKVDLVEAMEAKGWTYKLEGGSLRIFRHNNRATPAVSEEGLQLLARQRGLDGEELSIFWNTNEQTYVVAIQESEASPFSVFLLDSEGVGNLSRAFEKAESLARSVRPGNDMAIWRKEISSGAAWIAIDNVYITGGSVYAFLRIKNPGKEVVIFSVPLLGSANPQASGMASAIRSSLQKARMHRP